MSALPGAPCLRADISIVEQVYGGESSFVVKDAAAQKYFRFGALEVRVMRAFDGRRSAAEIAAAFAEEGLRISAQAVESFARTMAKAGFLERTFGERTTLELERIRAERRERQKSPLFRGEILRMRWSFGDPDALLERTMPYLEWMFSRQFVVASVLAFAVYLGILGARWAEFSAAFASTYSLHAITLANVAVFWITMFVVILIHELGHAYACKHFGGEVRELGFMLIYFQPAFYCNVSDAWSFPERSARLWVTAAGSWIQLMIASAASIVWWAAAPGTLVANVAVAAMLVGGVGTLLTNANPLIPLDGYFALTDWMEIPNLRHRAFAHLKWWMNGKVLRLEMPEPQATPRERRVFLIYGALAVAYTISLFSVLGGLLLGWAGRAFGVIGSVFVAMLLAFLLRARFVALVRGVTLAVRARRAAWRGTRRPLLAGAGVLLLLLLLVPCSLTSSGAFRISPASARTVSAADSGVVAQTFVSEGMRVEAGSPLVRLANRDLERRMLAAIRAVDSLAIAESSARSAGRHGDAARFSAERAQAVAALTGIDRRAAELTLRATSAGIVVSPRPEYLVGRRVVAGDSLLALAAIDSVELRIALRGAGASSVRAGQVVHAISFADLGAPWTAQVADVSTSGVGRDTRGGVVEARVRRAAGDAWRAGVGGRAKVDLARSNVLGALWWNARQLLRTDLLL